ncbi:MAG TPA: BBP7 family outer membrane beta-barrel protein [Gemmataceae bacterium]|nr:BBP7 family outer membrane beta-barrel protein [Gemmataceae bacterium]
MKKGRWIGSLLFAVLACVAELRAEDEQWQAVGDAPRRDTSAAATLAAPEALASPLPDPEFAITAATPPASAPAGLQPVSFETSIPGDEPPPRTPPPDIIAVSAPVMEPAALPTGEPDEESDALFAVDRPFARAAMRPPGRGIIQTSASVAVPAGAEVPMVPGWGAPVDASWGIGAATGSLPSDPDAPAVPSFNPLRPRLYTSAEYLLWWIQGQSVPVLATTSSPSDFGVLGAPTTQVLFGGNQINGNSPFSGGRFTVGYWLGCDQSQAVEITGFFLGTRSAGFSTNSSTNPVIGRPFVEANNGQETAQLTSLPNVSAGTLTIAAPTSLWGLAGNLRCLLCCGCNYRITVLAGFRNINLDESLTVTENVQGLPTAPQPFTNETITVTDRFATQNHFYGGNLGVDARWYWGRWSVDVRSQVALGDTAQLLDINGSQRFVSPTGMVQNFTGGLLALPSNIGQFSHNAFSVVPEVGANLGYQILPNLRGYVGYNFLYWSNVIRPGTSINPVLDVTQIPNFALHPEPAPVPGLNPAPVFHEVGLWAQGLTFGLEFVY